MFEVILILFVILESSTMGISLSILMLANDKLLDEAYEMGYLVSDPSRILQTKSLSLKDKLLMSLIPIPLINILAYFYTFLYASNNKKIITNLIEKGELISITDCDEDCHKEMTSSSLIQQGNIIFFSQERIDPRREVILKLKNEVLDIAKENISEDEKNQRIIKVLEDYEIIPNKEKVKKIGK